MKLFDRITGALIALVLAPLAAADAKAKPLPQVVYDVHDRVRKAKYVEDGPSRADMFKTCKEFEAKGGDCDDCVSCQIELLKGFKLDMWALYGHTTNNRPHMILVIRGKDGRAYVSSCNNPRIFPLEKITNFKPEARYEIDEIKDFIKRKP